MRKRLASVVGVTLAFPGIVAVAVACCVVLAACAVVLVAASFALPGVLVGRLIGGPDWLPTQEDAAPIAPLGQREDDSRKGPS